VNSGEEAWWRARCREEEEEESRRGKGVRVEFYRGARPCRREGEREAVTGQLRMASGTGVPLGCVAAARLWWPDVAAWGTASGGSTGGGRSGGATRGRGKGGAGLQELGNQPATEITRARQRQELGDSRKTMEDLSAKSRKARDPTVMCK
jgi:hypothetical protein